MALASLRSASVTAASQTASPWPASIRGPRTATSTPRGIVSASRMMASKRLDDAYRIRSHCGLTSQHDRVDAVVHRIRRVADLGSRRTQLRAHGLENLGRNDHRDSELPRPPRDFLLDARNALERQLETQVASSHHDRVGRAEYIVEMCYRFRPLELRDQRHARGASGFKCLPRRA